MRRRRRKRAVVLLSGGMDSATAMAVAKAAGRELYALSFDYGQRHRRELESARRLAEFFGVKELRILTTGLGELGGSALTDRRIPVPEGRIWGPGQDVPATYVPARNLVFLSLGAAYAEIVGAEELYIGASAVDYSGYPDCRPEFFEALEAAARLGTKRISGRRPVRILAPLLRLSKAEIVRLGTRLGVPYGLTWSCYRGGRRPCGRCDSCLLRAKGFSEAGLPDPLAGTLLSGRPNSGRSTPCPGANQGEEGSRRGRKLERFEERPRAAAPASRARARRRSPGGKGD